MKKLASIVLVCVLTLSTVSAFSYSADETPTIQSLDREYTFLNQAEYIDFVGGSEYFAGIRADGSLWMWGDNEEGQLGIGMERRRSNSPIKVMEDVAKVYPANKMTLVVKKDKSVWYFGGIDTPTPKKLDLKGVVSASLNRPMVSYITEDGKAYVKNVNSGDTTFLTDNAVDIKMVFNNYALDSLVKKKEELSIKESVRKAMSAPSYFILIQKKDGTLWEFGYGTYYNKNALTSGIIAENVKEMTESYYMKIGYFAIQMNDGNVIYFDSYGGKAPKMAKIEGAEKVYNSTGGPIVLKEDGTLWKWETNHCYGNNVKFYIPAGMDAIWMIDNNNKHYILSDKESRVNALDSHLRAINRQMAKGWDTEGEIEYQDIYDKTMEIVGSERDKYRQAKLVSEWIRQNIKYEKSEHDQSGVAAFRTGTGVCAGFASLTQIMFGYLGIPCEYMVGTLSGVGHAWNLAIVDGMVVFIDNTGGMFDYDYLMHTPHGSAVRKRDAELWASEEIRGAYDYDLIAGDFSSTFEGMEGVINRKDFCALGRKLIERTLGKDKDAILKERGLSDIPVGFTDTDNPDVIFLYRLGIIKGKSDTSFAPKDTITRQEAAVILQKLSGFLGKGTLGSSVAFQDSADIDFWASDAVNYVVAGGIMKGKGTTFAPKDTISVQESIIIFYRYFMENRK